MMMDDGEWWLIPLIWFNGHFIGLYGILLTIINTHIMRDLMVNWWYVQFDLLIEDVWGCGCVFVFPSVGMCYLFLLVQVLVHTCDVIHLSLSYLSLWGGNKTSFILVTSPFHGPKFVFVQTFSSFWGLTCIYHHIYIYIKYTYTHICIYIYVYTHTYTCACACVPLCSHSYSINIPQYPHFTPYVSHIIS